MNRTTLDLPEAEVILYPAFFPIGGGPAPASAQRYDRMAAGHHEDVRQTVAVPA